MLALPAPWAAEAGVREREAEDLREQRQPQLVVAEDGRVELRVRVQERRREAGARRDAAVRLAVVAVVVPRVGQQRIPLPPALLPPEPRPLLLELGERRQRGQPDRSCRYGRVQRLQRREQEEVPLDEMEDVERDPAADVPIPRGQREVAVLPVPPGILGRRVQSVESDELLACNADGGVCPSEEAVNRDVRVERAQEGGARPADQRRLVEPQDDDALSRRVRPSNRAAAGRRRSAGR